MRVTRRELIAAAVRTGLAAAAASALPRGTTAQAVIGKNPRLLSRAVRPPDLETPVALLDSFLTPADAFFVRSHMLPPAVDETTWTLTIDGEVASPVSLSSGDLRRMPSTSVTATLECAGNGRAFFDPPVAGIQWRKGAVGTARWTGVRLADLIERVSPRGRATHVVMAAADRAMGSQPPFVRQLPMTKAIHRDTLVAYAMNDGAIPLLNGAPLRMIVPGWEGAYSVKWLNRLTMAAGEHDGFWVANAYRYPTKRVAPGAAVDARDMMPLAALAVKSLITRPLDGAVVAPGRVTIAGFAWAGENDIARVEISSDGGQSWKDAKLTGPRLRYAWRRFEYEVDLRRGVCTIVSRATDARGTVQPIDPPWNPAGYLWNAPDQIRVGVGEPVTAAVSSRGAIAPAPSHDPAQVATGEAVYNSACRACHADDLADQQRLSEAGWGRTVDKMTQWGARVKAEEKSSLIAYLTSRVTGR